MDDKQRVYKVRTPLFPLYSHAREFIKSIEGIGKKDVTHLIQTVQSLTGTPQEPVDWTNPDDWIPERLDGKDREIATKIWTESNRELNPRHIYGCYFFANNHNLAASDYDGTYQISETGQKFLDRETETEMFLDSEEGLIKLLDIVSGKELGRRGNLLPEWQKYLLEHSKFKTASTFKDTLRRRLVNLAERGLIDRDGIHYKISAAGLKWLKYTQPKEEQERQEAIGTLKLFNRRQRQLLKKKLHEMDPYQFEYLVKDLLEAMGYENVEVTSQTSDKGVDVVGSVQMGITTVTEVVQVKRQKSNITRPVLDRLRGSLYRWQALRGTIITISDFAEGCKSVALDLGAAPITLINGERLVELLIEHGTGITKRPLELIEIDHEYFAAYEAEEEKEELD